MPPEADRPRRLALGAILAGSLLLRLPPVAEPFLTNLDSYGALYATAARNTLRHGLGATRGLLLLNTGPAAPEEFEPYVNHPPLIGHLVAASFLLFGESEAAARLVPLLFSVLAQLLLALLARRLLGPRAALLAALLFGAAPMGALHGTLVDPQGWLPMCALLGMALSYHALLEGRRWALPALLGWFLLGALSDWPAWLPVPFLTFHFLLRRGGRPRSFFLFPATAVLSLAASIILIGAAGKPGAGGLLLYKLASARELDGAFFEKIWSFHRTLFTGPVLAAAGAGALLLAATRARALPHLLLLALPAGLYILLSPQGAFPHPFWSLYLLPPVALAAAAVLDRAARPLLAPGRRAASRRALFLTAVTLLAGQAALRTLAEFPRRAAGADLEARQGKLIHAESRFEDRVLTSLPATDALRYYADRRIRGDVRTPAAVAHFLSGPGAPPDLLFLHLAHAAADPQLVGRLRRRFRERTAGEFLVYDLRREGEPAGPDPAVPLRAPAPGAPPRALRATQEGARVLLAWEAPEGRDVSGYRVHVGPAPGTYTLSLPVGRETFFRTPPLPPGVHHFAVTARDLGEAESAFSGEAAVEVGRAGIPRERILVSLGLTGAALLLLLAGTLLARP